MSGNQSKKTTFFFTKYRNTLNNSKTQPLIASELEGIGYDTAKIDEGIALLNAAENSVNEKSQEDHESKQASDHLKTIQQELHEIHMSHREIAKITLKNQPLLIDKLGANQVLTRAYYDWIDQVKQFYRVALLDAEIQNKFAELNLTLTVLEETQVKIEEVQTARADFVRERGESQDATKIKNKSLERLHEWMNTFYRVAKLALKDHPQLLESLDQVIKD